MSKRRLFLLVACLLTLGIGVGVANFLNRPVAFAALGNIQNIVIVRMENHNWTSSVATTYPSISGSTSAPYINNTIAANNLGTGWYGSYARTMYNPPHIHPSLPNYLWLAEGANGLNIPVTHNPSSPTVTADCNPYDGLKGCTATSFLLSGAKLPGAHQATSDNIFNVLDTAGLSWKTYAQSLPAPTTTHECALVNSGTYAVRHNPVEYFDTMTTSGSPTTTSECHTKVVNLGTTASGALQTDLANGTLPNFSIIVPDTHNDMHDSSTAQTGCEGTMPTGGDTRIWNGDNFLCNWVPKFLASNQFKNHGLLIIDWDEGAKTSTGTKLDGPTPFLMIGSTSLINHQAGGYHAFTYDHSSLVKSVEQLLGVNGGSELSLTTTTTHVYKAHNLQEMIVQTL